MQYCVVDSYIEYRWLPHASNQSFEVQTDHAGAVLQNTDPIAICMATKQGLHAIITCMVSI